jgi:hypothetical protein
VTAHWKTVKTTKTKSLSKQFQFPRFGDKTDTTGALIKKGDILCKKMEGATSCTCIRKGFS